MLTIRLFGSMLPGFGGNHFTQPTMNPIFRFLGLTKVAGFLDFVYLTLLTAFVWIWWFVVAFSSRIDSVLGRSYPLSRP
jgi:hypothetical protein